jgi:hypothetical protein
VASAARGLWSEGRQAEALSLLYRGALGRLVTVEDLPLKRSFTEEDCLACASKRLAPGKAIYLRDLTESWQAAAYGGRPPDHDRAMRLLDGWPVHFGASP